MTAIAQIFETLAARRPARRGLQAGETLFRAGGRVQAVYVISAGRLRLVRTSKRGSEITLHRAGAGESFAEPSLFSERYHCDAVAEVTSEVLEYPKADIVARLSSRPESMMDLLRHFGGQVHALRSRAEILSLHGAADRLMAYFGLRMPANADVLHLDANWKQIATELGLTHEALYRALRRLEDAGAIERDGATVRLKAPPGRSASSRKSEAESRKHPNLKTRNG